MYTGILRAVQSQVVGQTKFHLSDLETGMRREMIVTPNIWVHASIFLVFSLFHQSRHHPPSMVKSVSGTTSIKSRAFNVPHLSSAGSWQLALAVDSWQPAMYLVHPSTRCQSLGPVSVSSSQVPISLAPDFMFGPKHQPPLAQSKHCIPDCTSVQTIVRACFNPR